MQYREIYKALEHHWKVTSGMRWMDFSGWRQPNSALGRHTALLLVVEDPSAMRRICISHRNGAMTITYVAINAQGRAYGYPAKITCSDVLQTAKDLERLFAPTVQAA